MGLGGRIGSVAKKPRSPLSQTSYFLNAPTTPRFPWLHTITYCHCHFLSCAALKSIAQSLNWVRSTEINWFTIQLIAQPWNQVQSIEITTPKLCTPFLIRVFSWLHLLSPAPHLLPQLTLPLPLPPHRKLSVCSINSLRKPKATLGELIAARFKELYAIVSVWSKILAMQLAF